MPEVNIRCPERLFRDNNIWTQQICQTSELKSLVISPAFANKDVLVFVFFSYAIQFNMFFFCHILEQIQGFLWAKHVLHFHI